MSRSQKMQALVLSRRNIGEADRLVTLLTPDEGVLKVVAKGVRKIPSQRGGHLEPFTQILAIVRKGKSKEYAGHVGMYIGAVETEQYFAELRKHPKTLTHARAMAYAVMSLIGEEEPVPELYRLVRQAWEVLPNISSAKQDMVEGAVLLNVLRHAGMLPNWRQCQSCGATTPTDSVVLDAAEGGWHCLSCHNSFKDAQFSLPPRLVAVLRYLSVKPENTLRLGVAAHESTQLLNSLRYFMRGTLTQMSVRS